MFIIFGFVVFCFAILGYSEELDSCLTPSKTNGTCVKIHLCTPLLEPLWQSTDRLDPKDIETLTKSRCGFGPQGTIMVCCPNNPQVTTPPAMTTVAGIPGELTTHPNLRMINEYTCGTRSLDHGIISRGNEASIFDFPWMVLIAYTDENRSANDSNREFRCGGTLISERYILTAAHCVTGLEPGVRLSGVRIGEYDLRTETDCEGEEPGAFFCYDKYQDFLVESFHFHGEYRPENHQRDIALIRINEDANFAAFNVKPICLPIGDTAILRSKKNPTVTGWGTTSAGPKSQTLLREDLVIIPNEECSRIYEKRGINISETQLCAGGKNRMDSCVLDSGGPLQQSRYVEDREKFFQYGVGSFGPKDCGASRHPGVYTKVADHVEWILDTIHE